MKFTKRLLTIALSMGMVMPLCATAYAAPTVTINSATISPAEDNDLYNVTVTFTVEESSKQLTLLLTGPNTDKILTDDEIVHINQFGKNEPDEATIVSGSGTCTFSVSKARIAAADATVNESAGTTTLSVSMGADDADAAASADVTYVAPEPAEVNVTGVELGDTAINLTVGNKQTLVAVVKPADATNKNVTWTSSNTDVATVDATGVVTAVSKGEAKITVTTEDGGFKAECTVTVTEASAFVKGDANGDGEVDFADAIVVLRHDAGLATITGDNLIAADANGDEEVDFADAILILRYDSGLISSFN